MVNMTNWSRKLAPLSCMFTWDHRVDLKLEWFHRFRCCWVEHWFELRVSTGKMKKMFPQYYLVYRDWFGWLRSLLMHQEGPVQFQKVLDHSRSQNGGKYKYQINILPLIGCNFCSHHDFYCRIHITRWLQWLCSQLWEWPLWPRKQLFNSFLCATHWPCILPS